MPSIAHYFSFNAHTPAGNTLQGDTTTPGKAAVVADSDNSSTAAVYQAVVGVVGTLWVDNQDIVEGAAVGVEVENHHYTDAVVVAAVAVAVAVGHSSRHSQYHAVAEPMV